MLGAILAILLEAAATAPPTVSPIILGPVWIETPGSADWERARPKGGDMDRVTGAAVIACKATEEGRLAECKAQSQRPEGKGFGAAALSLAPRYRMQTIARDGAPVVGREVRLSLRFLRPPAPGVRLITRPRWVSFPEGKSVATYYPPRARRMDVRGAVVLECAVNAPGRFDPCTVLDEDPPEYGFAEASLELSKVFQLDLQDEDGVSVVGGTVRLPINWTLPN